MTFYERIKQLCKNKGVSIKEMERSIDLAENNAVKWKTRMPSSANLLALSEYFGVSTDYLLTGESDGIEKESMHSDPEIVELVNEVARIPEAKIFLSALKDMPKEDLEFINSLVRKMNH